MLSYWLLEVALAPVRIPRSKPCCKILETVGVDKRKVWRLQPANPTPTWQQTVKRSLPFESVDPLFAEDLLACIGASLTV